MTSGVKSRRKNCIFDFLSSFSRPAYLLISSELRVRDVNKRLIMARWRSGLFLCNKRVHALIVTVCVHPLSLIINPVETMHLSRSLIEQVCDQTPEKLTGWSTMMTSCPFLSRLCFHRVTEVIGPWSNLAAGSVSSRCKRTRRPRERGEERKGKVGCGHVKEATAINVIQLERAFS